MLLLVPSFFPLFDLSLVIVAALSAATFLFRKRTRHALPPGPVAWPLVGNLFNMPAVYQWRTFADWGSKYGNIISLSVLGQRIVVLNSLEAAVDLLDKRSAIYSDRPVLTMAGELMGWSQILGLSPCGDRFKDIRRILHQYIGNKSHLKNIAQCEELEEAEVRKFVQHLIADPDNFALHARRMVGSVILKLAYGYEIKDGDDSLVELVDRAMAGFAAATTPGSFLVDNLPFLQYLPSWMPGSGWQRKAKEWRREFEALCEIPYSIAKQAAVNVTCRNLVSHHLRFVKTPRQDHHLKMAAASLYAGGADTTVSAIHSFFLAMTRYPEVQKKAQEELDRVVGSDRLPTFADRDHLPYLNALCLELFRWQPIGPLGLPHRSTEDSVYQGYLIPKGSIVLANIWNILHNTNAYKDPMEFRPERFLSVDGSTPELDPRCAVFGFGRRVCPGMCSHLAEASVFITCATTLAAIKISEIDGTKKENIRYDDYTSGTISHPKQFRCSMKPRSAAAAAAPWLDSCEIVST